jgi:DNA-binding response OmpR family regulator
VLQRGEKTVTKILLAEDQIDLREMIALTLRLSGYEVLTTEDGAQAYQQATATLPDLIILDLEMPLLSGSEVCRRLKARQELAATPVLIMSSHADPLVIQDSLNAGAREYLRKPFELDQLLQRVDTLLTES